MGGVQIQVSYGTITICRVAHSSLAQVSFIEGVLQVTKTSTPGQRARWREGLVCETARGRVGPCKRVRQMVRRCVFVRLESEPEGEWDRE